MAVGTVKVEVEETIDESVWIEEGTDLATNVDELGTMVQYTPKPGVVKARFKFTEEGNGPVQINVIAGIR